jgi:hypothetical protein
MPTTTSCHDIFNTARAKRTNHPLTMGQYKLHEAERAINKWRDLVMTVATRIQIGGKFRASEIIGPCMANERGTYLKSIPALLAELIGYYILPAIAALEGDGVSKSEVQRLLSHAETDAKRLIADCEAIRLRLKGGIKQEYDAMRQGQSHLIDLIDDALALAKIR